MVLNVRNNFSTQHVLSRFGLEIFMYWTCYSMNNLPSYCGLVDAKITASDKDLPVCCYFSRTLKWVKNNLTFSWHSGFERHKFLHFLSHFGRKKSKNVIHTPGFEPAIKRFVAHCANHYTTDTCHWKWWIFKLLKDVCYINRSRLRFSLFLEFWGCSDHWDLLHSFLMY